MGSKNRHAKELLPIILKDRRNDDWYAEPFVGGFNMIDKVVGNRIANDINFYLIELFIAIQKGWRPPDNISEKEYQDIRTHKENYPSYLVGFVGFGCSYSGKWFGGYARGNANNGSSRNYCLESKKNILSQYNGLQGIKIYNKNYWELDIPANSIIYCDPPYENTTKYKSGFDHNKFWQWCEKKTIEGNKVFVSEYHAPGNWKSIWSKEVHNTLVQDTGSKSGVENLFVLT
jgi:DNA adenine methylase